VSAPAAAQPVRVSGHQGTPEWLDNRRDVIGSSDIPVITGSSPYRTSLIDLWAVKTRELEPVAPDPEDEERYWWGHALEEPIAQRYSLDTGRKVRRVNDQLRHPVHGWVGASLDRVVVGERRICEVKWAPRGGWSASPSEPVPGHVQDQVQWQLLVRGWSQADVAVLDGDRLAVHHLEADTGYQDDLLAIAHERLWRHVEAGTMPKVDGSEETRRTLASLANRRRLANDIHLDARQYPDLADMALRLRAAQQAEKAAKGQVGTIKNAIGVVLLGAEASGVDGDGWRIDWHQNKGSERVVANHEAIATAYRRLIEAQLAMGDIGIRGALRDAGFDPDQPDVLDAIAGMHTTTETRDGARPMRLWVKDEENGKWQ
jgi:putative phage-type endonuclease